MIIINDDTAIDTTIQSNNKEMKKKIYIYIYIRKYLAHTGNSNGT